MYTQEAINNNSINTRNKYYRAMVDYKYNKLINNYRNIAYALTNPNLTKKDLYYLTMAIDDRKRDIMDQGVSCIDSDMVTFDHKKLTLNIVNKDDTDIDDIVYTLKEDVVEIIQEAIVNINANTFATDYMLDSNMSPIPYRKVSNNALLYNSIEVVNLMSNISVGNTVGHNIDKDNHKLFCIERILKDRMTRHNVLFLLDTFDETDPVRYYIKKISRALLESPDMIHSVNARVKSIKFKKEYSIKAVEDCAIRVMSRLFDIIKLDLEAVNHVLTLFKEENKETNGLPKDAVEFLDYFYRGIIAGYLPYRMIYLEGNIGYNHLLNLIADPSIDNPSVDDYKKQLDQLTYEFIVDGIIRYHEDRLR